MNRKYLFTLVMGAALTTVHAEGLEEVIVTAQKREQSLQDVAVSVTALSTQVIEEADIHDLEGVASRTPSLNYSPFSPGQVIITLRGASSSDDGAGTDNSTALFLDDVYLGRGSNINFELDDIERIEVLRGPQGTLYGRNTIGGAINVVSRKPSVEESYGGINLSTGNYNLRQASGYYSVPLSDNWAIKVSASSRQRDGWGENVLIPNANERNQNTQTGRLQLLWQGDKTSVLQTFDANYLDIEDIGRIPIAGNSNGNDPIGAALNQYRIDTGLTTYDRDTLANPINGFSKREAYGYSLKLIHELDEETTLEYIAASRSSTADWEMDSVGASSTALTDNIYDDTEQVSSELRLHHAYDVWNITYGLWLYSEITDREESFDVYGVSLNPDETLSHLTPVWIDSYRQKNETTSYAFFGQSEVSLYNEGMIYMILGLRYSVDEKTIDSTSVDGSNAVAGANFIINSNFSDTRSADWADLTYKLTLGFRLTEDHHLYLDYSTGFKSGGFAAAPTAVEHLDPLRPETAVNIELGYKGKLTEAVQLNLTYFNTEYTDLQYQLFGPAADDPSTPNINEQSSFGFFRTFNASDASISGLELELQVKPSEYFFLGLTYTFNDSEYKDAQRLHTGGNFDGKRLLRVPEHKASLLLSGDVPYSDGYIFRWVLDYRYEDETLHDLSNDLGVSPAHAIFDARMAFIFPQGFELALWGRNLADEVWVQHIYTIGPGTIAVFGEPLTTGFSFKYSF